MSGVLPNFSISNNVKNNVVPVHVYPQGSPASFAIENAYKNVTNATLHYVPTTSDINFNISNNYRNEREETEA